jgi:hypothetical protein
VSNSGILITWPQLLYLGILFLSFYVLELLFFWWRHGRGKGQEQIDTLKQEINELQHELSTIKVRLAVLAAQWPDPNLSSEEPTAIVSPTASTSETPYARAIRLAKNGVDANELVTICSISRGEADLIVAIYRSAERG